MMVADSAIYLVLYLRRLYIENWPTTSKIILEALRILSPFGNLRTYVL